MYVLDDIPLCVHGLVFVIKDFEHMHRHIQNLVFKYLGFVHPLGFLRKVADYIQYNHSGIILIQMDSDERN